MVEFMERYFYILIVLHCLMKENIGVDISESPFSYTSDGNSPLNHYKTNISDIPYHVLIAYNRLYCSGALIRSKVVVTAASCFIKWKSQRIVVKVGADIVTGLGNHCVTDFNRLNSMRPSRTVQIWQVIEVLEVKKHEYFGHSSMLDNDIALLILKEHVTFSRNVMKILMTQSDTALQSETSVKVSGWGYTGQPNVKYANNLLRSEMNVLNIAECVHYYPNMMTTSNFCAKYLAERRLSDNGGPAVMKEQLVGILSYGADRSSEPHVAVLTSISYFHKWITLNTKRFMMKYCTEPATDSEEYDLDIIKDRRAYL